MTMKTEILTKMADGVEAAESKSEVCAPLVAMLELLNAQYKQGAFDMESGDKMIQVFNYVDIDLFAVNLAINSIYLKAWTDASSFDEMKTEIAKMLRHLKKDLDAQISANRSKTSVKGELRA